MNTFHLHSEWCRRASIASAGQLDDERDEVEGDENYSQYRCRDRVDHTARYEEVDHAS
jgi:hypothetical protein